MILDKFLNLEGTSIQGYRHLENIGIVWPVESKNKKAACPRCGLESDKLHQNHRHLVKDLPLSGQPVYLQVNRRQFKCNNCRKPFSEELDFVASKRTYTKRLAENILEQLKEGDIWFFVTCYGSIGWHKSTKSLSGKRLNWLVRFFEPTRNLYSRLSTPRKYRYSFPNRIEK